MGITRLVLCVIAVEQALLRILTRKQEEHNYGTATRMSVPSTRGA
jgi:hypothetical protein